MTNHDTAVAGRWIRRGGVAALAAGALALTGALAPVSADPGSGHHTRFTHVDLDGHGLGLTFTPASQSNKLVNVMLQMQGDPVVLHEAAAKERGQRLSRASQRSIRNQLQAKQDKLTPAIHRAGGRVVAQLQSAYNGVQVQVREKDVAQLAGLPGVTAVHQVRSFEPANTNGVPYIGGPEAWGASETGKGVKVAVIDTGIDYTHKDFGGLGTTAAWKYAQAHSTVDPTTDPELSAQFGPDAPKVKGGSDLVGDDYDANDPTSVPKPDANPLDCNGHGSHTAGTAAGFGVLGDGSTYAGPWNKTTVADHAWNVGPGVAPEADIYAYRVFGCEGSTNVTAEAIDRAVADHVDVISMSLGSDFGGVDDPTTVAADNAAKAGISVVAASGNAGQNAYMTSSPASANHVLSVAALDGSQKSYPGAKLSLSSGGTVSTIDANGAPLPSGPLPVKVLKNADGSISLGCDPNEYTGVDGALVVTTRGTCARVARAVFGQKAGAAAVLMVNSDGTLPPYEGPITGNPDTGEAYKVTIPFLGAAGTADNVAALKAADGGTVTLTPQDVPNTGYSRSASFTSAGPRNPDSAPKPEVIAPGVSVASVGMGTGDGFAIESGTSMATPMTSGAAALVKQAHPTWSGDQIKAALQNTADPSLNGDYDVRVAGTGAVQVQKAIDTSVLAQTADGLNSLAYGFVPGTGSYHATKAFTLTNTGDRAATYDLSVEDHGSHLGAEVKLPKAIVSVPAGGSVTVPVDLSMSAQAFKALSSDDTFETGVGQVQFLGGDILATPEGNVSGQQALRVAYLMVPRGLSDVRAGRPSTFRPTQGGASFRATLPVTNSGLHDGTADVYAWGLTDGKDAGGAGMDVRDVGVQSFPDKSGDSTLVFAVNNWGSSTNQSVNEFDVAIDNNHDGQVDYFVVGVDIGAVLTGTFDGRFGSITIDARTNQVVDAFVADAPMNGSVVELPAVASELGVTGAHPRFDYSVTGFSVMDSALADPTGTASFDAFHPTVDNGQFAEVPAGGHAAVPLTIDRSAQRSLKDALGWLVVSVDDASGAAQADEVRAPAILGR